MTVYESTKDTGWWLVYPSEKYESIGMMKETQYEWDNKIDGNQTTNQLGSWDMFFLPEIWVLPNHPLLDGSFHYKPSILGGGTQKWVGL